eukprot:m.359526 g.359526  ORF g.359526 m.359526 type:complete len:340 (-) comp16630_c0_seq1:103-1122(-)
MVRRWNPPLLRTGICIATGSSPPSRRVCVGVVSERVTAVAPVSRLSSSSGTVTPLPPGLSAPTATAPSLVGVSLVLLALRGASESAVGCDGGAIATTRSMVYPAAASDCRGALSTTPPLGAGTAKWSPRFLSSVRVSVSGIRVPSAPTTHASDGSLCFFWPNSFALNTTFFTLAGPSESAPLPFPRPFPLGATSTSSALDSPPSASESSLSSSSSSSSSLSSSLSSSSDPSSSVAPSPSRSTSVTDDTVMYLSRSASWSETNSCSLALSLGGRDSSGWTWVTPPGTARGFFAAFFPLPLLGVSFETQLPIVEVSPRPLSHAVLPSITRQPSLQDRLSTN